MFEVKACAFCLGTPLRLRYNPKCYRGGGGPWSTQQHGGEVVCHAQGICAHVAGAKYFLGPAVMQACGEHVVPGTRAWSLLFGALTTMTKTSASLGLTKAGIGNMKWRNFAGTTLLRLTGSGGNWWRQSQSEVVKWVSALRPTQRRAPNSHCRPPTSPCKSLI